MVFLPLLVLAAIFFFIFRALKARKPDNHAYKSAVGLSLAAAFLLFWVNGAVGIIGASRDDVNMLYGGVFAVGLVGSILVRFEPNGMALVLFTAALVQTSIAAVALMAGWGASGPIWPWDILGLTVFFTALWIGAALLFRKAAQAQQLAAAETAQA